MRPDLIELVLSRYKPYPICVAMRSTVYDPAILSKYERSLSDPGLAAYDRVIADICQAYVNGDEIARGQIGDRMRAEHSCIHFAERRAVTAMRTSAPDLIRQGLLAIAIEQIAFDYRESTGALAMLQHAAHKMGADFGRVIREVADVATLSASQFMIGFASYPYSSETLRGLMLREALDPFGITFVTLPVT
jgi:hypothetical protein